MKNFHGILLTTISKNPFCSKNTISPLPQLNLLHATLAAAGGVEFAPSFSQVWITTESALQLRDGGAIWGFSGNM
jgi:hypothetical protein